MLSGVISNRPQNKTPGPSNTNASKSSMFSMPASPSFDRPRNNPMSASGQPRSVVSGQGIPPNSASLSFPVDLIITWVDGSDDEWQDSKNEYLRQQQGNLPADSISPCRYRDFDQLRWCVESAMRFAPWLRKIHILTDHQRPYWTEEMPSAWQNKVVFVDHPLIFTGECGDHWPTFNSHAIESHLHEVPDLAEHFLYANDDTLFGSPVNKSDFFTPQGQALVFITNEPLETAVSIRGPPRPSAAIRREQIGQKTVIIPPSVPPHTLPYFTAQVIVNQLLDNYARQTSTTSNPASAPRRTAGKTLAPTAIATPLRFRLKHQIKAFVKTAWVEVWDNPVFRPTLIQTSATRFRSIRDVCPTTLVLQYMLVSKQGVAGEITSRYYAIEDETDLTKVFKHLQTFRPTPKLLCINDCMQNPSDQHVMALQEGLEKYLPHKNA